eukprot:TRINITY_DN17212_c0_g1_i2.p1 TRINITY_DN17212_c0_g1~~TRINITY_DN17212_c0_g1_i2.p1  ORF type:complete len:205 (+),score=3.86 TRINITY_DN17212_c0_g1_i2:246-860(+)
MLLSHKITVVPNNQIFRHKSRSRIRSIVGGPSSPLDASKHRNTQSISQQYFGKKLSHRISKAPLKVAEKENPGLQICSYTQLPVPKRPCTAYNEYFSSFRDCASQSSERPLFKEISISNGNSLLTQLRVRLKRPERHRVKARAKPNFLMISNDSFVRSHQSKLSYMTICHAKFEPCKGGRKLPESKKSSKVTIYIPDNNTLFCS